jgi:hypothetical protein
MVLLIGPVSIPTPQQTCKVFLFNTTVDRLFYCQNKYGEFRIFELLATLTQPLQIPVWVSLMISTILIILVLKVEDPLALIGVIVGQSGVTRVKRSKSGKTETFRNILLVIWSLLISTSISFLYNGLLTADMLVPVPDKVIETFKQLILSGFKIAYPIPIANGIYWYRVSQNYKLQKNNLAK